MFFEALFVEFGIEGVEVLFVELVGENSQVLAEALIMHNLACSEEAYRVLDVIIIAEPENVIVSRPRLLFRECYLNSS